MAQLRRGLLGAVPPPAAHPLVPRRIRPGPRAPRPGSPDAADHRSAGLRHRADPPPLRRHRLRRHGRARRPPDRAHARCLPSARPAPCCWPTTPRTTGSRLEESVAYADSASDLAMLEAVGFPVAVNPESRLSAIARRRGWHVEHWAKAAGGSHRPLPSVRSTCATPRAVDGQDEHPPLRTHRCPRFAAARLASSFGSGRGAGVGPLRLVERGATDRARRAGWVHVRPAAVGHLRLRPGHPRRAQLALLRGHRLVPLRSRARGGGHPEHGRHWRRWRRRWRRAAGWCSSRCSGAAARGIEPLCPACAAGQVGSCGNVAFGHLRPGLQTGFCADTGGGWSSAGLVAHSSQLYAVPDGAERRRRGDGRAHGLRRARRARCTHARTGDVVAVIGAGTLGLLVTAALSHLVGDRAVPNPAAVLVGAATPTSDAWPASSAPPRPCAPEQLARAVRRHARSLSYGGPSGTTATLSGGADVVLDCVGSAESIAQALAMVRPRGAGRLWSACPARCTSTWRRCGTGRSAWPAPTPTGPSESRRRRGRPVADLRPGLRGRGRPRTRAVWSRPPTRSPVSRTPWPTPARPAAAAPSRSHSTRSRAVTGKDPTDEPPTRLRSRGGQVDSAHPVLERRGVHPRDASPRGAGSSTRPSPSTPIDDPYAAIRHALLAPGGRPRAAAGVAARPA